MKLSRRIQIIIKAILQLGAKSIMNYALYKIGLKSGYFRLATPQTSTNTHCNSEELKPCWFLKFPNQQEWSRFGEEYQVQTVERADEICLGKVRLFGGEPTTLNLHPNHSPKHWTDHEKGKVADESDVKFIWEPARFDWAIPLGKAYFFTQQEKYAKQFWKSFDEFQQANPVNTGPNWQSGQEIAIRLLAWVIALHFFKNSDYINSKRLTPILIAIADHATRIPQTISYAKAQDNNHLVSEAVGLFTAGCFLSSHPRSKQWRRKGLKWYEQAILSQIDASGEYSQHSTNYHRMMIMLSLWMNMLLNNLNVPLNRNVENRLIASVIWLETYLDKPSGKVTNLGHNDGSNILQFSNTSFADYRPVLQAASRAFLGKSILPSSAWDNLSIWLGLPVGQIEKEQNVKPPIPFTNRIEHGINWAILRAARFSNRPAHADQLHVDIWQDSINIALDPGTFQYNAADPWQNGLAGTKTHNTICINGKDQMTRSGKFLWLDWAQAAIIQADKNSLTAVHEGYKKSGIRHERTLISQKEKGWQVIDRILPIDNRTASHVVQLHWLAPDYSFEVFGEKIKFLAPFGVFWLELDSNASSGSANLEIFRAGVSVNGSSFEPNFGWYSPTYGVKIPAISIRFQVACKLPLTINTHFIFEAPRH